MGHVQWVGAVSHLTPPRHPTKPQRRQLQRFTPPSVTRTRPALPQPTPSHPAEPLHQTRTNPTQPHHTPTRDAKSNPTQLRPTHSTPPHPVLPDSQSQTSTTSRIHPIQPLRQNSSHHLVYGWPSMRHTPSSFWRSKPRPTLWRSRLRTTQHHTIPPARVRCSLRNRRCHLGNYSAAGVGVETGAWAGVETGA